MNVSTHIVSGMLEVVVSGLLQAVKAKLSSVIQEEWELWLCVRGEVENLGSTLSTIQAVLEDAEERQLNDKAVQNWLRKLKDAAYDADDTLDEFATEALRLKAEIQGTFINKVGDFFSSSNPVVFNWIVAHKIKEIVQRFDAIAKERSNFHLKEGAPGVSASTTSRASTSSLVTESEVYGREEDKKKLLKLLNTTGDDDEVEGLSVIPIVGMGGLGKTTLAQLACNDAEVRGSFNPIIWVCVSDPFDVGSVIRTMIEKITKTPFQLQDMDSLQCRLREMLNGKKFLLVLDDVWEENGDKWEELKKCLQAGSRGSKVIVTTRSKKVTMIMGTLDDPFELATLSDDDCWSVFKQQAFGRGRREVSNLVILGKEIAKKCRGVPLAAKALGSLMYLKEEEKEWRFVKESEIWNSPEEGHRILPALRLSYYQLPSHLKQCFAYCSIFPKDSLITKKKLIQLWIAQGFIPPTPPSQGCKKMVEDTGAEYFNDLLWRSFFQDVEKDQYGNIISCKMHDLMHDLAQSVAGAECSIVKVDSEDMIIPDRCRHLSLACESEEEVLTVPVALNKAEKYLRTLYILPPRKSLCVGNMSIHFLHLRVLELSGYVSLQKESLVSIGELKQLRYLDLSHTKIQSLPDSITTLYNLQTLRLLYCWRLEELPRDMRKMTKLRHLEIEENCLSTGMPANMGELKFLQTLPVFIVGKRSGFGIRELQYLNLQGKLKIKKLENVMDAREAQEAKLKEKSNLQTLEFLWGQDIDDAILRDLNAEKTLDGLQPHLNLKKLKVICYPGNKFPHWMMMPGLFPNLVKVELFSCKSCRQLPPLGKLPSLKFLKINDMEAVKCFGNDFYGDDDETKVSFPSLKNFTLTNMANLEEWSAGFNGREKTFPLLHELNVIGCPQLTTISAGPSGFLSLQKLTIKDCLQLTTISAEPAGFPSLEELFISNCLQLTIISAAPSGFPSLRELTINNCSQLTTISAAPSGFPSLQELIILHCSQLTIISAEQSGFPSVQKLYISECSQLTTISAEPSGFSSLQKLTINNCSQLTTISAEPSGFPCLQTLIMKDCLQLITISAEPSGFPCLQTLIMKDCLQLLCSVPYAALLYSLEIQSFTEVESLPDGTLRNHPHLLRLSIKEFPELKSLSGDLGELAALEELTISHCSKLVALPEELRNLTSLRELQINYCHGLTSLKLQGLTSLQRLTIEQCWSLASFVGGMQDQLPASLEYLQISDCPELASLFPELQMHRLTYFSISACDKLTCLPEGLKHATNTLRELEICDWQSVTPLPEWIANFSSLQRLKIGGCRNLVSLPSGFQHLTNLEYLQIFDSPQLKERCAEEVGEDWRKIAHIPNITIDGTPIILDTDIPMIERQRCGCLWELLKATCIDALLPPSSTHTHPLLSWLRSRCR